MNPAITVSCSKYDPLGRPVKKFSNSNVDFKYLRTTSPDPGKLSPLAVFLVSNVPACVAGVHSRFRRDHRVRCLNGKTEADVMRAEGRRNVENWIKIYGLDKIPCAIDDWLFDVIKIGQDDNHFWNAQAEKIIAAGIIRVEIGDNIFMVEEHGHG